MYLGLWKTWYIAVAFDLILNISISTHVFTNISQEFRKIDRTYFPFDGGRIWQLFLPFYYFNGM